MAWTTPKTNWATGELVAADDMNAIGENLATLERVRETVAAHTTTDEIQENSGTFVDVDSENLSLTITTTGGDVLVHFHGTVARGAGSAAVVTFDIDIDGNRQGANDGIVQVGIDDWNRSASFTRLIQSLSSGSHAFKLQWKHMRSVRLKAGAQFWVREI